MTKPKSKTDEITVKLTRLEALYIVGCVLRDVLEQEELADKYKKQGFSGIAFGIKMDCAVMMQGREKIRVLI
jgi:hypothetical protein